MATKVKLTPAQTSEKWARRTKGAVADAVAGVNRVTESPTAKAASKQTKMLTNLTASIQDGTWAKRLEGVSLDEWKTKTAAKMAERLAGGVDGAAAKREKFDTWLVGTLNEVLPAIDAMPDLTIEDSVNRVRTLMEHLHSKPYKKV